MAKNCLLYKNNINYPKKKTCKKVIVRFCCLLMFSLPTFRLSLIIYQIAFKSKQLFYSLTSKEIYFGLAVFSYKETLNFWHVVYTSKNGLSSFSYTCFCSVISFVTKTKVVYFSKKVVNQKYWLNNKFFI